MQVVDAVPASSTACMRLRWGGLAASMAGDICTRHPSGAYPPSGVASPGDMVAFCPRDSASSSIPSASFREVDLSSTFPLRGCMCSSPSMSPCMSLVRCSTLARRYRCGIRRSFSAPSSPGPLVVGGSAPRSTAQVRVCPDLSALPGLWPAWAAAAARCGSLSRWQVISGSLVEPSPSQRPIR